MRLSSHTLCLRSHKDTFSHSENSMDYSARDNQSSSRQKPGQVLWIRSQQARGEPEILREEFAILPEEATLLFEVATLALGESQQLLAEDRTRCQGAEA